MDISLPLDQMSVAEKLRAIETIWDDLCRTPAAVPSPSWHADVLAAREKRFAEGDEGATEWEEAKRRIRDSTG